MAFDACWVASLATSVSPDALAPRSGLTGPPLPNVFEPPPADPPFDPVEFAGFSVRGEAGRLLLLLWVLSSAILGRLCGGALCCGVAAGLFLSNARLISLSSGCRLLLLDHGLRGDDRIVNRPGAGIAGGVVRHGLLE